MPPKTNVQFTIKLPSGPLLFPVNPVTIPSDACFFWPFNLDLGKGVRLAWATAQPITAIDVGNVRTVFFAGSEGVPAQFAFDRNVGLKTFSGRIADSDGYETVGDVKPGVGAAMEIQGPHGALRIVLLDDAQSLSLWKSNWQGRDRMFLTRAGLVADGDALRLTSTNRADLIVAVYPAPSTVTLNGEKLHGKTEGVFENFTPRAPDIETFKTGFEEIQPAGPPRKVPLGKISQPVAAEPEDADFTNAAIWRVKVPADLDLGTDPILRLQYVGDVARVTLNGKLLTDDFYNGNVFEVGLRRYAPAILAGDLRVEILPLRKDAPIMLAKEAAPDFGDQQSLVSLDRVEIIPRYQIQLSAQ